MISGWPSDAQSEPSYDARVQYERGAHALRGGDLAASLVYLERAVSLSPDFVEALSLYGSVLLADGQNEEASKILARLGRLSPGGADLDFHQGIASYRMQKWADAVRYLEAAAREGSQSGQLYLYLGISQQELGHYEDARTALHRAAELDPSLQGPVEYRLGLISLQDSPEDARAHFDRVGEVAPDSAIAESAAAYSSQIDSGYFRSWGLTATLGGGYDSNVSLAGEVPLVKDLQSGFGTAQVTGRATLVDRDNLVIDGGAGAYIEYHGGAPANFFDQVVTQGWLRATMPISSELDFTATYKFQYIWANYSPFRLTNSGDFRLRYNPTGRDLSTHLFFHVEGRDYRVDLPASVVGLVDRDGVATRFGFDQYVFLGDWWGWGQSYLAVGFRYRREHSDGTEFSSNGMQPNLSFGVPLPKQILWTTYFGYEWRNFDNPSCFQVENLCAPFPVGAPAREDRIAQLTTDVRIPVTSSVEAAVRYRYWNRQSNYSFYHFDRNLVQVLVTYLY